MPGTHQAQPCSSALPARSLHAPTRSPQFGINMKPSSPSPVCPAGARSGAGGRQSWVDGFTQCGRRGGVVNALSSMWCQRAEGGLGAPSPRRLGRLSAQGLPQQAWLRAEANTQSPPALPGALLHPREAGPRAHGEAQAGQQGRNPPLPTPTARVWCKAQLCRVPPERCGGLAGLGGAPRPGRAAAVSVRRVEGVCACEPVGR